MDTLFLLMVYSQVQVSSCVIASARTRAVVIFRCTFICCSCMFVTQNHDRSTGNALGVGCLCLGAFSGFLVHLFAPHFLKDTPSWDAFV